MKISNKKILAIQTANSPKMLVSLILHIILNLVKKQAYNLFDIFPFNSSITDVSSPP
jgi:hypothetical protein